MLSSPFKLRVIFLATAVLIVAVPNAVGQRKKRSAHKEPTLSDRVADAKSDVARAAADYKASLEKLLVLEEAELKSASEALEKRKSLPEGIISRREIEESERVALQAEAKVRETRRQMSDADELITEAQAAEQLARMPQLHSGGYYSSDALIRYAGTSQWLLSNAAQVENFFAATFKRALPVSAFGQTPAHDRLGFDHRNSLDVAVHPDSEEGQALMSYLRSAGIPFIAFRHAVPGSATGAHIHVGYPSRRISAVKPAL